MNLDKLNQWLLLVSHLGILGGLILVTVQVQQESEIARAQLFSDITSSRIEMAGVMMGENPAQIVGKALETPDTLSTAELYVMDAFFIRGLNEVRRAHVLNRIGLDLGIGAYEDTLSFYFGSEIAQRWWTKFESHHDGDEVLSELDQLVRTVDTEFTMNALRAMEESQLSP